MKSSDLPTLGLYIDFNRKITEILDFRVSDRAVQSTLPGVYRDIDRRFRGIGSILKNCWEQIFLKVFHSRLFLVGSKLKIRKILKITEFLKNSPK